MAKFVTVVLDPPKRKRDFGKYAGVVLTKLTNNKNFSTPSPTLAVYGGHCAALTQADSDVANKLPGAVTARKAALEKVTEDLGHLVDYVQGVVESLVGVDLNAIAAIVASAGMKLKTFTPRAKYELGIKAGLAPASLECTAPSSPARDTNEWEYSTDGKAYVSLGSTRKAILIATGLPLDVQLYVRHRTLTKDGYTPWSDPPLLITLK